MDRVGPTRQYDTNFSCTFSGAIDFIHRTKDWYPSPDKNLAAKKQYDFSSLFIGGLTSQPCFFGETESLFLFLSRVRAKCSHAATCRYSELLPLFPPCPPLLSPSICALPLPLRLSPPYKYARPPPKPHSLLTLGCSDGLDLRPAPSDQLRPTPPEMPHQPLLLSNQECQHGTLLNTLSSC